jgi:hypothetical protein
MAGQQRQLGTWKFGFQSYQRWKQQNHIAEPSETNGKYLSGWLRADALALRHSNS